jgi:hypothetical protein
MWALFRLIVGLIIDLFRSRAELEAEVLVLKQQIIVLRRVCVPNIRFSMGAENRRGKFAT